MNSSASTFISKYSDSINGWLYPGAIYITESLLDSQKVMGIDFGGVEIGVFQGKYLSFLAMSSTANWIGLDVFLFGQLEIAKQNIDRVIAETNCSSKVNLIRCNTQTLSPHTFAQILCDGGVEKLTFASIDGDHSSSGVFNDLRLIEQHLYPGGIIAIDDMFSGSSPAVSEGFFQYMNSGSRLRPIAFSDNKLFMTTPGHDELYRIRLEIDIMNSDNIVSKRWNSGPQTHRIRPFLGGTIMSL